MGYEEIWYCSFAHPLQTHTTHLCAFFPSSIATLAGAFHHFMGNKGNLFHQSPSPILLETAALTHVHEETWRAKVFVRGISWALAVQEAQWGAGQVIPGKEGEVINPWGFVIGENQLKYKAWAYAKHNIWIVACRAHLRCTTQILKIFFCSSDAYSFL